MCWGSILGSPCFGKLPCILHNLAGFGSKHTKTRIVLVDCPSKGTPHVTAWQALTDFSTRNKLTRNYMLGIVALRESWALGGAGFPPPTENKVLTRGIACKLQLRM